MSTVYTENGLEIGLWTIKVTAENSERSRHRGHRGQHFWDGHLHYRSRYSHIQDRFSETSQMGRGGLNLTLTWPEGALNPPVTIEAYLRHENNIDLPYTYYPITFVHDAVPTIEAAYYTVALSPGLTTGYYSLHIFLLGDGSVEWGYVESVRIVNGVVTEGNLELDSSTGGCDVECGHGESHPDQLQFDSDEHHIWPRPGYYRHTGRDCDA